MALDGSSLALFVVTIGTNPGSFAIDEVRNLVYVANARNLTVIDANRANPNLAARVGMAMEFYHGGLDHFVLSSDVPEISRLDNGATWIRTGQTFGTFLTSDGSTPVCRFYIPPSQGDSHLMMANPEECSATAAKFPSFIFESLCSSNCRPLKKHNSSD